jgi:hypothetical protein
VVVAFKKTPVCRTISLHIRNKLTFATAYDLVHILAHLPKATKKLDIDHQWQAMLNSEVFRVLPKPFVMYAQRFGETYPTNLNNLLPSRVFMLEFIRVTDILCYLDWWNNVEAVKKVLNYVSRGRSFCKRFHCSMNGLTRVLMPMDAIKVSQLVHFYSQHIFDFPFTFSTSDQLWMISTR